MLKTGLLIDELSHLRGLVRASIRELVELRVGLVGQLPGPARAALGLSINQYGDRLMLNIDDIVDLRGQAVCPLQRCLYLLGCMHEIECVASHRNESNRLNPLRIGEDTQDIICLPGVPLGVFLDCDLFQAILDPLLDEALQ